MSSWQSKLKEINPRWNEQQLCDTAGLFALPHLTTVDIIGEDAEKFLQGQLTCDLDEVTDNHFKLGACCTQKGRMVAIFRLLKIDNGYQFILDVEVAEVFIKHLSKYIPFFKAEIVEPQQPQLCLGLSVNLLEISNLAETKVGCSCPYGSGQLLGYADNRWILVAPSSELDKYWSQFNKRVLISNSNDWQYLDMLDRLAAVKSSSIEKFLPHEVALPEAGGVSFSKGCYTGQEIVARMHYLGKLNKHAQLLSSTTELALEAADKLLFRDSDKILNIGNLINMATNSAGETLALACIKDKFLEKGEFEVNGENGSILKVL